MKTIKSLIKSFVSSRKKHKAYSQLCLMTDRELSDIGISRGDIYGVVYK